MATERRGELTDFGRKTEVEAIRDRIHRTTKDGKVGFTVYRVAYGNDEDFTRFLELLTAHVHAQLDEDDCGDDVKLLLDWNVQDDEAELNGASINQIRE